MKCVICSGACSGLRPGGGWRRVEWKAESSVLSVSSYCVQMWSPQYRRDMTCWSVSREGPQKMIQGMEQLPCENRLRELGLFSLERGRLWGDLRAAFQYLKGGCKKERGRHFSTVCWDGTKWNSLKLKEERSRLDIRKKYFAVRGSEAL